MCWLYTLCEVTNNSKTVESTLHIKRYSSNTSMTRFLGLVCENTTIRCVGRIYTVLFGINFYVAKNTYWGPVRLVERE